MGIHDYLYWIGLFLIFIGFSLFGFIGLKRSSWWSYKPFSDEMASSENKISIFGIILVLCSFIFFGLGLYFEFH